MRRSPQDEAQARIAYGQALAIRGDTAAARAERDRAAELLAGAHEGSPLRKALRAVTIESSGIGAARR